MGRSTTSSYESSTSSSFKKKRSKKKKKSKKSGKKPDSFMVSVHPEDGGARSRATKEEIAEEREAIIEEGKTAEEMVEEELKWFNRVVVFLVVVAFFVWLGFFLRDYKQDKDDPGTSVEIVKLDGFNWPTMTFCNIDGTNFLPVFATQFAGLDAATATPVEIDRTADFVFEQDLLDSGPKLHCYSLNVPGSVGAPYSAGGASFNHQIDAVFVMNTSRNDPNIFQYAIVVGFYPYGQPLTDDIVDTVATYASPGVATNVLLQPEVYENIKHEQTLRFSPVQSTIALANDNPLLASALAPGTGLVSVTIQFKAPFSLIKTKEAYSIPLTSAMAEIAGMLGTLLGIDLIGCIVLAQVFAFKLRAARSRKTQQRLDELDAAEEGRSIPLKSQ